MDAAPDQSIPALPEPTLWRRRCSQAALVLAWVLLAATFFLICPPPGETYPGALAWRDLSVLQPLTEVMSLGGVAPTLRGVEIKDLAFHLAAAAALLLLGVSELVAPVRRGRSRAAALATYAQILLSAWVALSLLSTFWSGDPALAGGQAVLYALQLAWAIALANLLERQHVVPLLVGLMVISAAGAALAVWYYYERNPFHRAGFPVGNPTTLAAAILPAILLGVAFLARSMWLVARERRAGAGWHLAGTAAALVPLMWCLVLTRGRGAMLALAIGLATMLVLLASRRSRWVLAAVFSLGILVISSGLFYTSRLDVTMARGAAMRFRFYAWRYAATLWNTRPMVGHGAGAYPRLAGQYAVRDEALDPGAFMGEIVEHAHNELFEVLAEIGLVGGVTFVGGWVATLFVAAAILRARPPNAERWLRLALIAGIVALLADAMVGVTFRLPGVSPVFFTLLACLWVVARTTPDEGAPEQPAGRPRPARAVHVTRRGVVLVCVCGLAGVCAAAAGIRNWNAVRLEYRASEMREQGAYDEALRQLAVAEAGLLDPVSKLAARDVALRTRFARAESALAAFMQPDRELPSPEDWQAAHARARETYQTALQLLQRVPALRRTNAIAARSAEFLAELYRVAGQAGPAQEWLELAEQSWRRQLQRMPFDVEALVALTSPNYGPNVATHLALLRDGLRFRDMPQYAAVRPFWFESLNQAARRPEFVETLEKFSAGVGPISPETDLEALIASRAPELYRLKAAWHAHQGEFGAAADAAARAVALYEPMRPRFPTLYPLALREQAAFTLQDSPHRATLAIALLTRAIEALPVIQVQKYAALVRPYRYQLALAQLAAGREEEARAVLAQITPEGADPATALADAYVELSWQYLRRPAGEAPDVRVWLRAALAQQPAHLRAWSWLAWLAAAESDVAGVFAVLQEAAAAGVPADGRAVIRRSLCAEFPALCDALKPAEPRE